MRLRTTAVALAGALTLVLPAAATALADDGKALSYSFQQNGESKTGQVSDLAEDKCHALAVTDAPIEEAVNETDKVALFFDNKNCEGEPVAAAGPGEKAGDFEASAVAFESDQQAKPAEPGEKDKREDAAQAPVQQPADSDASDSAEEESDYFDSPFRTIG
ncbi:MULTISPECIES: hypothetical protein [Streptomyces]|uniref:hypothetical protein n=1 Tax=Streptomyces TaxID=1883 RepID=UPI000F719F9A|nr:MULTISPECIES: hypothetical protein [unclassified Streptomyces]AZM89491.1 hypothetical protein D1J60_14270 [Streptomyces sp. W1SF4]RSS32648.1 hypothetical protein EF912_37965 [Streptomyces sp. WAC07061]